METMGGQPNVAVNMDKFGKKECYSLILRK